MTTSEAEAITAELFAAWPSPLYGELTVRVYVEEVEPLSYERALDALGMLIRDSRMRPSVAELRETYLLPSLRGKYEPKELPLPEATPEERAENLRLAREAINRLAGSMEMP